MRAMLSNPDMLRQVMNPQAINAAMQMMQGGGGGLGGLGGLGSMGGQPGSFQMPGAASATGSAGVQA